MGFTFDVSTPLGVTRLLCADFDPANHKFEDEEVNAILNLEAAVDGTQYPRFAAAQLLEIMASDQLLVLGQIELLDLKVNAPEVAKALRAQAERLRETELRAAQIDYIEEVHDPFSARERIYKQWLRQTG